MSVCFKPYPTSHRNDEALISIRNNFRKALLEVGKSPDCHVFDLSYRFLDFLKDSPQKRYLVRVKRHYDSLDANHREVFVKEILEVGRHYNFWYLENYSRKEYTDTLRETIMGARTCLA